MGVLMKAEGVLLDVVHASLQQAPPSGRFLLALSGGVDSMVLLHLLHSLRDAVQPREIAAIHINHQLHADAPHWAALCQRYCDSLHIPLEIVTVQVVGDAGPEGNARNARYAAIQRHMQVGDLVLSAHQRDDQVETLLLNLLRGSGLRGLAGMPAVKSFGQGWLLRPLLAIGRAQILAYAQQHNLRWVADPSNSDGHLARNFLRHSVVPLLQQRWPAASASIATTAGLLQQSDTLISANLEIKLRDLCDHRGCLDSLKLQTESIEQQAELVRHWCRNLLRCTPPRRQLQEFLRQLAATDSGKPTLLWSDCLMGRYQSWLFAHRQVPAFAANWQMTSQGIWQGQQLNLPHGLGLLEVVGQSDDLLQIAFRQGGERMLTRGLHQDLKTIFQHLAMPPWLRHAVPLVYRNARLCAVGDLLLADDCPDLRFIWHKGPSWPMML